MKDYKNDPYYWIQFDQDIENLPIDSILLDNEEETIRIKELLWDAIDDERQKVGISFLWYDVHQFLENRKKLSVKILETDNLEEVRNILHDSENVDNLCVIECRDSFIPSDDDMKNICNLYQDFCTIYATVLNKDIQKKFKINFIYQQ